MESTIRTTTAMMVTAAPAALLGSMLMLLQIDPIAVAVAMIAAGALGLALDDTLMRRLAASSGRSIVTVPGEVPGPRRSRMARPSRWWMADDSSGLLSAGGPVLWDLATLNPAVERSVQFAGFEKASLTVLSVDIRGSSELIREVEARVVGEFIFELGFVIGKSTSAFGGTAVRSAGGGSIAIFGVGAGVDAPELAAVRAACMIYKSFCELRSRWTAIAPQFGNVGLAFGVATGPVIAGHVRTGEVSHFSMIGEAATLAPRLLGVAREGEVATSPTVARILENRLAVRFDERGANLGDGGEMPVQVVLVEDAARALAA